MRKLIMTPERITVDLLCGDHEGRQRMISWFTLRPYQGGRWLAPVARHWIVDRPDPR